MLKDRQASNLATESVPVLLERIESLESYVQELEENIRILKGALYGRSSERRPAEQIPGQMVLPFDGEQSDPLPKPVPAKSQVRGHQRRKPGRKPLPPDLPRVEKIIDLPADQKIDEFGRPLKCIGQVVSEQLCIKKAEIYVLREIRLKYAKVSDLPTPVGAPAEVRIPPAPPRIVPKGIASADLVAHVAIAKFGDGLPLKRQEDQFRRLGVKIGRATMANWLIIAATACSRLLDLLMEEILAGPVINMDETRIQVLGEPGRANTAMSYMWVCRGGRPGKPGILFRYEPSRAGRVPQEILGEYQGYLQTDGYSGYQVVGERPGIRHLGCWAHVRRKFVEVIKGNKGVGKATVAQEVVDSIRQLYAIEDQAREEGLTDEQVVALRDREARPVLDGLKALLDQRSRTTPPRSLLGKAVGYALSQWPRLTVYLEKGFLRPDNNLAENAIRPFAVGRKGWLFSGSPRGAWASAFFFSIIETAKANGIAPDSYLRFLFSEVLKATTDEEFRALLPQNLDRSRLPS